MTNKEILKKFGIPCKNDEKRNYSHMTSKEALSDLSFLAIGDENHTIKCKETIEKDLEVLEEYRKIEEEIGIDLIKAVELCKQANSKKVVYIKDEWGIYPIKILDILDVELANHRLYSNFRGIYVSLDLYDYGKTWALTKEELEGEKDNIQNKD